MKNLYKMGIELYECTDRDIFEIRKQNFLALSSQASLMTHCMYDATVYDYKCHNECYGMVTVTTPQNKICM